MEAIPEQNLLIDADDTLWENNIYFERVITAVQMMLQPLSVEPGAFRLHLNEVQCRHIPIHGYGTLNFTRSLVEAFQNFLLPEADLILIAQVEALALGIMNQPLEIIEGVPETLEYLSCRHSLYLVTKGDRKEQSRKIELSRLGAYFRGIEILSEKSSSIYRDLQEKHAWDPSKTWMVGNSLRSDINPAISAGLNAVFIPHPHTWVLEQEDPVRHPRLIELERFSELRQHF